MKTCETFSTDCLCACNNSSKRFPFAPISLLWYVFYNDLFFSEILNMVHVIAHFLEGTHISVI